MSVSASIALYGRSTPPVSNVPTSARSTSSIAWWMATCSSVRREMTGSSEGSARLRWGNSEASDGKQQGKT